MVDLASHLADQNGWLPESDVFTNPSEDSLGSFLSSPLLGHDRARGILG